MKDHLRDVLYVFLSGCLNVYILLFLGGAKIKYQSTNYISMTLLINTFPSCSYYWRCGVWLGVLLT